MGQNVKGSTRRVEDNLVSCKIKRLSIVFTGFIQSWLSKIQGLYKDKIIFSRPYLMQHEDHFCEIILILDISFEDIYYL